MAGTLNVDTLKADSNLKLQIASANVAFIDSSGLNVVNGNLTIGGATGNLIIGGSTVNSSSLSQLNANGSISAGAILSVNASLTSVGTLPRARLPAGSILNVWTNTLTSGESLSVADGTTTPGAAWTDSSLNITVTPSSSTSNFLVFADVKYACSFNAVYRIYDVTGSTVILGTSAGTNRQKVSGGPPGSLGTPSNGNSYGTDVRNSVVFYTPASGSSTRQFKIQFLGGNQSGTVYVGRNQSNTDNLHDAYSPCTLTILEVAA